MAKWSVQIDIISVVEFEGIEAKTEAEAKEKAVEMFYDDIDNHILIDSTDKTIVTAYKE